MTTQGGEGEKGFTIIDKRGAAQEAAPREEAPPKTQPEESLPEITFSAFLFSLAASVRFHLGEIPDPETGETATHLPLAKQTIDLLSLLQEKTRGNLAEEEDAFLTHLLYELRLAYVKKSGK
jgi:hypothetical protein